MSTSQNHENTFDINYLAASLLQADATNDAEQATLILHEVESIPGGLAKLLTAVIGMVREALASKPIPLEAFAAIHRASIDQARQIAEGQED